MSSNKKHTLVVKGLTQDFYDDVIGQYFSATGTPYYVVDVDEDAYWAAVERHAIAH